jgi:hypothetical protein
MLKVASIYWHHNGRHELVQLYRQGVGVVDVDGWRWSIAMVVIGGENELREKKNRMHDASGDGGVD